MTRIVCICWSFDDSVLCGGVLRLIPKDWDLEVLRKKFKKLYRKNKEKYTFQSFLNFLEDEGNKIGFFVAEPSFENFETHLSKKNK